MPPRDPRLRPSLEVARPDDFTGARSEPVEMREPWEIRFGDGQWHKAGIISRWTAADGRQIIEDDWMINGGHWTETYFAGDGSGIREPED